MGCGVALTYMENTHQIELQSLKTKNYNSSLKSTTQAKRQASKFKQTDPQNEQIQRGTTKKITISQKRITTVRKLDPIQKTQVEKENGKNQQNIVSIKKQTLKAKSQIRQVEINSNPSQLGIKKEWNENKKQTKEAIIDVTKSTAQRNLKLKDNKSQQNKKSTQNKTKIRKEEQPKKLNIQDTKIANKNQVKQVNAERNKQTIKSEVKTTQKHQKKNQATKQQIKTPIQVEKQKKPENQKITENPKQKTFQVTSNQSKDQIKGKDLLKPNKDEKKNNKTLIPVQAMFFDQNIVKANQSNKEINMKSQVISNQTSVRPESKQQIKNGSGDTKNKSVFKIKENVKQVFPEQKITDNTKPKVDKPPKKEEKKVIVSMQKKIQEQKAALQKEEKKIQEMRKKFFDEEKKKLKKEVTNLKQIYVL